VSVLAEVEADIAALYGSLPTPRGVVHVVSAARGADGRLHVLRIGPDAPKSSTDFFVLQLCRARADAVLTTAEILRAEPGLSLAFAGGRAAGLAAYRRALGKERLSCVILTRTGDLPDEHPLWHDELDRLVLTTYESAPELRDRLAGRAEVLASSEPDPRMALAVLRGRGKPCVSVEAGPSTAGTLYGAATVIDELWLSRVELSALRPEQLGGALPDDVSLFARLRLASEQTRDEESGPWRFQRWLRAR
jgi:riboflavin biosynthesis pyrimidine reductase